MSNEIKIKISSEANTAAFKDVKRELHDVETASDKAGNAIAKLGRDIDKVDGKKIKIGVEMPRDDLGRFLPKDQTAKVKVGVEPDSNSGVSFMKKFSGMAMGAAGPASKLLGNHVGITVGAAAGVAAAPVLAASLGAALSGGIGAGVIGAGVALAVKGDKNLQSAGKQAGKNFMDAMTSEAKVLAGPARESLVVLESAGDRVAKKWGSAFQSVRGDVVPFVKDVVVGAERLSDAMTNVVKDGSAVGALGKSWRLLADGVGDFIETTATSGEGASDSLILLAGATGSVVRQTGELVAMLGEISQSPWLGPVIPVLTQRYKDAAAETGTFTRHTQGAASAMDGAAAAARGERGALEALSKELKAQADPVFAIVKAQDDLKAAQKETAKATKEHGKDSAEAEAALQKQALAALSLEANIGLLGDTFDGKMTPAMRNTLKAAGVTAPAIKRLEKQFRDAKKAGDRFSDTYSAKMALSGGAKTIRELNRARGIAASMDGYTIDIAMRVTGVSNVSKAKHALQKQYAHGGIGGAAEGGARSGLTWVGEAGPELMDVQPGSRIWSNPDSRRMLANSGGGGGSGGPITVNLVVDGRVLAQTTVEPTRAMIERQAGGNAQRFWGKP